MFRERSGNGTESDLGTPKNTEHHSRYVLCAFVQTAFVVVILFVTDILCQQYLEYAAIFLSFYAVVSLGMAIYILIHVGKVDMSAGKTVKSPSTFFILHLHGKEV